MLAACVADWYMFTRVIALSVKFSYCGVNFFLVDHITRYLDMSMYACLIYRNSLYKSTWVLSWYLEVLCARRTGPCSPVFKALLFGSIWRRPRCTASGCATSGRQRSCRSSFGLCTPMNCQEMRTSRAHAVFAVGHWRDKSAGSSDIGYDTPYAA